jgi:D-alanyl-lipoteichoic acid acyltransferase DltB (MBOAT superfamily)
MVWGFFKKVVIADNLAVAVNHVYGNVESASGLTIMIATGFFAYQIYCDFSGYSDIAIGSSKILGIDLMENFKRPYFSTSIKEFWSRWHISLSTWFRDYVYIPLGGSKKGSVRTYVNILLVFLISGLWHGASWMFVIWGAIHGLYQLYERLTFLLRERIWKIIKLDGTKTQWFIKWIITMMVVLVSWVFFRASSLAEVNQISSLIVSDMLDGSLIREFLQLTQRNQIGLGIGSFRLVIIAVSILILELFQLRDEYRSPQNQFGINESLKFTIALWMIILFGSFGLEEFIYFQF